jgi:hypothetical protein
VCWRAAAATRRSDPSGGSEAWRSRKSIASSTAAGSSLPVEVATQFAGVFGRSGAGEVHFVQDGVVEARGLSMRPGRRRRASGDNSRPAIAGTKALRPEMRMRAPVNQTPHA